VHILLSKADKLSGNERAQTLRKVKQAVAEHACVSVQLFSSLSRMGAEEAAERIESLLGPVEPAEGNDAAEVLAAQHP
jgi:GTP-binding protein